MFATVVVYCPQDRLLLRTGYLMKQVKSVWERNYMIATATVNAGIYSVFYKETKAFNDIIIIYFEIILIT